jgi:MFS superfamily sulfate permease-like transporter
LFFGNADQLSATIDQDAAGARVVILDFNRVSDIDISGALVLKGIDNQLTKDNKKLYL